MLAKATPIYDVGTVTLNKSCPAFADALWKFYLSSGRTDSALFAKLAGPQRFPLPALPPVPTPTPAPPPSGSGLLAYEDFTKYSTTAQILAFCTTGARSGDFWSGANKDGNCAFSSAISYDTLEKAVRYAFPARPTCAYPPSDSRCNLNVQLAPRLRALALTGSELWVRYTDKLSTGFKAGGAGAVGSSIEYKALFLDAYMAGYPLPQFQVLYENGVGGAASTTLALRLKLVDYRSATKYVTVPLPATLAGAWHTWVFGITGIGGPEVTFVAYLDGVQVAQVTGPWMPGQALGTMNTLAIQLGANINNGPDQAQSRWFRELGIYTARPPLAPLP